VIAAGPLLPAGGVRALAPSLHLELRIAAGVPEDRAARIRSAVQAQLVDVAVVDDANAVSARTDERSVVLIDEREQQLVLQFMDARGVPLTSPRIVASAAEELEVSEAASIVRAYLVARSESPQAPGPVAVASTARAPVARDEPVASPTRAAELPLSSWRGWLSVLYTGTSYAPELAWQSGLAFEAGMKLVPWLHAGASYDFHPPVAIENPLATVIVSRHDFGAFVGFASTGTAFGASLELGGGVTETLRTTRKLDPRLTPVADSALLGGSVMMRLRARVRLPELSRLALDVAPALELVSGAHPLVVDDGSERTLLTPSLVRVRCDVGASFDLL
jgi:hypothetical protein